MPNNFKTFTDTGVGTSNADVYTCPSSTETTIIGLNIANILTVSISVYVQLIMNDGENVHIVKNAIVPVGSSLVAVGGDQKIVWNASDTLRITASQASAADVTVSLLEIS